MKVFFLFRSILVNSWHDLMSVLLSFWCWINTWLHPKWQLGNNWAGLVCFMPLEMLSISFEFWVFGRQQWAARSAITSFKHTNSTSVLARRAVVHVHCVLQSWQAILLQKQWGAVGPACAWPLRAKPVEVAGAHSPFCQPRHWGSLETAGNRSPGSCKTHRPAKALEETGQGSLLQPWVLQSPAVGTKKAPFLSKSGLWNESPCPQAHSFWCGHQCDTVKHFQYGLSQLHFPFNSIVWFTPDSHYSARCFSFAFRCRIVCTALRIYFFLLYCILCLGFLSWDDFFSCFNKK